MNKLQKILTDLTPEYSYRVKFACEPSSEELHKVVTRLTDRYDAFEVGPMKKTIFQDRPTDFYNLDCGEIWMFDFKCNRGVQPQILLYEIGNLLSWSESLIHVRDNLDPYQEELADFEDDIKFDEYEPRLLDPDYKEVPEVNAEELGGQGRADKAVKDAIDSTKKKSYAEYMSAGFGKKG
jgi:hypothetical protein